MKDLNKKPYRNYGCCEKYFDDDIYPPKMIKHSKTITPNIKNVNTCICKGKANGYSSCPPKELIKNGGFETLGTKTIFADWDNEVEGLDIIIEPETNIVYEGRQSANFDIGPVGSNTRDTATLTQIVSVNPGCYLTLSFAERLAEKPVNLEFYFRAEVYYISESNNVELIKIERLVPRTAIVEASSFSYHEKTSDIAVPEGVNFVVVKFTVSINTIAASNDDTDFYLDGVSLRAVN